MEGKRTGENCSMNRKEEECSEKNKKKEGLKSEKTVKKKSWVQDGENQHSKGLESSV